MSLSITIALNDEEVAMLRSWGTALRSEQQPPEAAHSIVGAIVRKAYVALGPEPVRITVELPPFLVEKIRSNVKHVPPDASVDLWRHLERALRQAKAAGEPLT